jgi:hypothetical protein
MGYRTLLPLKSACFGSAAPDRLLSMNGGIGKYVGDSFRHQDLAITCPKCRSIAFFSSPYVILHGDAALAASADPQVTGVPLRRGGFAIERFPNLFPWNDPKNRSIHFDTPPEAWGIASCSHCPYRKKHQLSWPEDAFYKINLSCGLLWAQHRDQLVKIRECIADSQHRGWMFSNRLNKNFFLKRNRDRVLRGIDELLSKPEDMSGSKTRK